MSNWITEQVVIGGETITLERWPQLIEELGISAVMNLREEHQDVFSDPFPISYLWLPIEEHTIPSLNQMLIGAQFIDSMVRTEQRVFVHCKMGIGRSPTIVAAYLVWAGQSVDDAIQLVQGTRRFAGPVVSRNALIELANCISPYVEIRTIMAHFQRTRAVPGPQSKIF